MSIRTKRLNKKEWDGYNVIAAATTTEKNKLSYVYAISNSLSTLYKYKGYD